MRTFIWPIIIILVFLCAFSAAAEPDSYSVRKVHQQLVEEVFPSDTKQRDGFLTDLLFNIIEAIYNFFSMTSSYILIPLLIGIVFVVGYIGMKLYNRFFSGSRMKEKKQDSVSVMPGSLEDDYLKFSKAASECARNKRYSDAAVFLHRSSVFYLKMKRIVPAGEYRTNAEIRNNLKTQKEYEEPFVFLARAAEQVTFGKNRITEEKYIELAGVYEKNFHDRTN